MPDLPPLTVRMEVEHVFEEKNRASQVGGEIVDGIR
jgi:hypothetical protein